MASQPYNRLTRPLPRSQQNLTPSVNIHPACRQNPLDSPQPEPNRPSQHRSLAFSHDTPPEERKITRRASAAPLMGNPPENVVFCTDDIVSLKDDELVIGVIDRSFGDVDTHSPRPQRDYPDDIERHSDVPYADFERFMQTGVPPRGTALVTWQSVFRTLLLPEARLNLLDRAVYVGDVVKRTSQDHMSGTVIGTQVLCRLFPSMLANFEKVHPSTHEHLFLHDVTAPEIINVHEYNEGGIVVYQNWVGRIERVIDDITVRLANNSVVIVDNPDDLEGASETLERLSVGDPVATKKGNLRRGRWRYGAFDPNVKPEGFVVETRALCIDVRWLARKLGAPRPTHGDFDDDPIARLDPTDMESPDFYLYDASASAAVALPFSADGQGRSYHVADIAVGDRSKFKDHVAAATKYDGSQKLANGRQQGKLTHTPRTETLGYDVNSYIVMQTNTTLTIQWQDLSVTQEPSRSIILDPTVEDEDEVWPGEIVYTKRRNDMDHEAAMEWVFKPAKVGIVQTVNSRDRLATVRWFEKPNIQFLGEDLIPPCTTGKLQEGTEDVSLYDIETKPSLNRRRGDFVLVHPGAINTQEIPVSLSGPDWFGEVIDLGLDGSIAVRLGAAKPVVDVRIPVESVTLAYSSDMRDGSFDGVDGESLDEEDEEYDGSDFDSASFNEMWIEYEGMDGGSLDGGNEEDWSTEDELSDGDTSMPDLEPIDGARTTNTTPETHAEPGNITQTTTPHPNQDPAIDATVKHNDTPSNPPAASASASSSASAPASFLVADTPVPQTHHFISSTITPSNTFIRRIVKEHKILRTSLPPNIFVRTWETRLDLLTVLIIGPSDTPYEHAPFLIDLHLPATYPSEPPRAFFHSWTQGNGPVNPNLYQDGKICLSLLGTWHADERGESWNPSKSTLLQVLVSILGLVLVKEPYYNEAGYDVHRSAPETKLNSALYTERAYFRARGFIAHALSYPISIFDDEIQWLYRSRDEGAPRLLDQAIEAAEDVLRRSADDSGNDSERDGLRRISLGATVMLSRQVERLKALGDGSSEEGGTA
ncbi:unnamed protein product [Periconia digitata]|uniref:UBC core domain-containing protein n=1 Tax=Periconia digitata TaxID=1303443 RepID=A0A9W4UUM3_9PLEO|nr:unnamed protein product [Periconia digitata]